jgi:pimeloyl-ACP methyl ester carboxylesterase
MKTIVVAECVTLDGVRRAPGDEPGHWPDATDLTDQPADRSTHVRRNVMKRRTFVAGGTATGMALVSGASGLAQEQAGTATPAEGETVTQTDVQSGYAPVNGLQMYYEIHGTGEPLVLLPGGFMTVAMLEPLVAELAQTRQVIAVELEGHGHTPILNRPLRFEQMADDVAALIQHLGLAPADLFGYSTGGETALQTAIRHPDVVRKLVLASTSYASDGWYPEILTAMGSMTPEVMTQSPYYEPYLSVAPNPDDWPVFVDKMRVLLAEEPYDWADDVAAIETPTLLIFGDADSVRPEHIVEMFRLLGGGVPGDVVPLPTAQLAILPRTAHSEVWLRIDWLAPMITEFLDEPMPEAE